MCTVLLYCRVFMLIWRPGRQEGHGPHSREVRRDGSAQRGVQNESRLVNICLAGQARCDQSQTPRKIFPFLVPHWGHLNIAAAQ